MTDPLALSYQQVRSRLGRDLSVSEIIDAYLDRIASVDAEVQAYVTVTAESARREARALDARIASGEAVPPLAGLPVAIKDNICTRGVPTTCGSQILRNFAPPYDATAVRRLREAGAVVLGKTNLDEFAMGSSTENSAFGPTRNPWNFDAVPGGSSGGSAAAVAAGAALASLGSDTGGSIRLPAGLCGVVGLKPTYGRVSRYGLVAFASSLDQIGPLAGTVADCALVLQGISGHDPFDSTSVDLAVPDFAAALRDDVSGLRVGLPTEFFGEGLRPAVRDAVFAAAKVLEAAGAVVEEVTLPTLEYALPTYYLIACAEVSSNLARYGGVAYGHRAQRAEDLYTLYAQTRAEGFGAEVKRRIMLGTFALSAGHYEGFYKKAQQVRTLVRRDFDRCFERVDLLATPVSATAGFWIGEKVDDPLQMYLTDIYTIPVNLAGLPGISVPCGFDGGLPIGLQLIGRPFDEAAILRAAHAYEQATEWHKARPALGGSQMSDVRCRMSDVGCRVSDIGYRISEIRGQRVEDSPRTTDYGTRSTDIVIGLEIHVQLLTHSKMFCGCSTRFAAPPNTQTCPVCLGLPGSLPVINRRAVELGLRTALALHCTLQPVSQFHRKNYYYPDLPKNYQISQYQYTGHPPLATDGHLEIETDGGRRQIRIRRVHLEEDTAKLVHPDGADHSLVDYNRSGVPLMEIVTQPDLRSPAEAAALLRALRQVLQYADVSTGRMEEGTLRCDANVSLRRPDGELGTRTEVKNVNSIRSVERALAFEVARQREVLGRGGDVAQETRHWDERRGVTFASRTKEEAEDYRYFPEPDLVPIEVSSAWVAEIASTLPEMADARRNRFVAAYGLGAHEAGVLVQTRGAADFFEEAVRLHPSPQAVANWQIGDVAAYLNEHDLRIEDVPITPAHLAELVRLIEEGAISGRIAKEVVPEMLSSGRRPGEIVRERGLVQIHDEAALRDLVRAVIADNPQAVGDLRAGKERAIGALVGQVMKRTQGRANPAAVNRLLREELVNSEQ